VLLASEYQAARTITDEKELAAWLRQDNLPESS
jgi:hypothetical protein